jgi:hypothetical protein
LELVEEVMNLWISITGYDPEKSSFRMGEWDLRTMSQELKESISLDETSITTLMMMDYFILKYLDSKNFAVNHILNNFADVMQYLKDCKRIYDLLKSKELVDYKNEFKKNLIELLNGYGVSNEEIELYINDSHDLAFVRRDALNSIKNLNVYQFFKGEFSSEKVRYLKVVHEFKNINELIGMVKQTSGNFISLNLIKDVKGYSSYFVFTIKNGGNIYILTDYERSKHPLQKYMTRRPERNFTERVYRNRFPYELLNLSEDDMGRLYINEDTESVELSFFKQKAIPLKMISQLQTDVIIWIFMMFNLIERDFFTNQYPIKELAYTGEMVTVQNSLNNGEEKSLLLPTKDLVELKYLSNEDIDTEHTKDDWQYKPARINEWIEKKYEKEINDELLNLIGNVNNVKLLSLNNGEIIEKNENDDSKELDRLRNPFFDEDIKMSKSLLELQKLDSTTIGTLDDIVSDYKWTARYNKALLVNGKVNNDFEKEKENVIKTYRDMLFSNIDNLLKGVAEGEFFVDEHIYNSELNLDDKESSEDRYKNILQFRVEMTYDDWTGMILKNNKFSTSTYEYRCFINGKSTKMFAKFMPTTARALAKCCGCGIEELPEPLQHYSFNKPYIGNSILDRLDPMDWVVKNPWNKLKLKFYIPISRSGYNKLQKDYNIKSNKFWNE